jgi:hypothetical protein
LEHILTITLNFPVGITRPDFSIRYILADTIEQRGLGEVIDEGSGVGFMDICIKLSPGDTREAEIISLLESLGLKDHAELYYEIDGEETEEE